MAKRLTKEQKVNVHRYGLLASLHGYNEMAKRTDVLGEKVYFRMLRDQVEQVLASDYGITIKRDDAGPVMLTLGHKPPFIIFHERDIEMMRQTVADYDVAKWKDEAKGKAQ